MTQNEQTIPAQYCSIQMTRVQKQLDVQLYLTVLKSARMSIQLYGSCSPILRQNCEPTKLNT